MFCPRILHRENQTVTNVKGRSSDFVSLPLPSRRLYGSGVFKEAIMRLTAARQSGIFAPFPFHCVLSKPQRLQMYVIFMISQKKSL